MALGADGLRALDSLLDEGLELRPEEREPWLAGLATEFTHLVPMLRELLTHHAASATAELLGPPPDFAKLAQSLRRPPADGLIAGAEVGSYRLLRELGAGGMGVVWLAERIDGLIDRPVALKLPLFAAHNRTLAERFARERAILARLTHPHIARLYDAGITSTGQPFLALEYVEGEPLTHWCDARMLGVRERVGLVVQVLQAVQYAHANLIIHRDLKPSNILVTAAGEVRLLDFGIAKLLVDGEAADSELTRVGGRALTPSYAAPELLAGANVGIAADIYSMGVILYELLAGARPYRPRDDSSIALQDAVLHADPARPSLSVNEEAARRRGLAGAKKLAAKLTGDLDTITLKALKKRPEERYPTAAALAADLGRHLRGEAIDARADSTLYRVSRLVSRHRLAFGAAAVIAVALVGGASVALWQADEARREAALSHSVQEFMLDLFRVSTADQPDPVRARKTTARELLDRGSARITSSLRDQPKVRLELLATLSDLYKELGMWAEASDLAAQRVELARSLFGANDLRLALAISQQVSSLHKRENADPAALDRLIREALRIHESQGDKTSLALARLHERASIIYFDQSSSASVEHASRAVEIFRAHYPNDRGYPLALSALGTALLRTGKDWDRALQSQDEALRVARAIKVTESTLIYLIRRVGETNAFVDRGEEADVLLREALAISERVNGPKHAATVAIRRTTARNLAWISRFDEAAEMAARTIADTMAGEGREPYFVRDTHRILFDVHWARGDIAAAREGAAAALSTYGASPPDSFEHADLLAQSAAVDMVYGRHADALAKFERATAIAKRAGTPRGSMLFHLLALREGDARIAVGDARGAKAVLEAQLATFGADSSFSATRAAVHEGLAEALLALGEVPEARAAALRAEEILATAPRRTTLVIANAQAERTLGKVRMAEGLYAQALTHLERSSAFYRSAQVPDSPFRAEVEALRAACLARMGRRIDARAALALARSAPKEQYAAGAPWLVALREAEGLLTRR